MKKIGIITFHDTTNFGSFLQTYGLYKAINECGFKCEIIDYKCEAIEKKELPLGQPSSWAIKDILRYVLTEPKKRKKYNCFQKSLRQKMTISRPYNKKNIETANSVYDIFITGSDILWDLDLTDGDMTYFQDFVGEDKIRIAFGTSIGDKWDYNSTKIVLPLLNKYNHIALRELESAIWLESLIKNKVDIACDPTMLVDIDTWVEYAESFPKDSLYKTKDYILVYFWTEKSVQDAIALSQKYHKEVWVINYGVMPIHGVKNIKPHRIEEFLSLIKNASLVMTSSYHGMLFSFYFNIPFYVYLRDNNHNVRFVSLLQGFTLADRIYGSDNFNDQVFDMDFEAARKIMKTIRNNALKILREYLE